MFTRVREALAAVPGIDAAATSFVTPVSGSTWNLAIRVPGFDANDRRGVLFNGVSPNYFSAMGTPLLAGRDIADTDRGGAPNVMVVNEAFAKKYFNGENPVGKTFTILGFTKIGPIARCRSSAWWATRSISASASRRSPPCMARSRRNAPSTQARE